MHIAQRHLLHSSQVRGSPQRCFPPALVADTSLDFGSCDDFRLTRSSYTQHLQRYSDHPGKRDFENTALRNYPDAKSLPLLRAFAEHTLHEHSSNVGIASTFRARRCQGLNPQGVPLQCASLHALLSSHLQPQDQSPATNILRRTLDSALYLRLFLIDYIDHHSPSSTAVVMDTIAVSLISRINPSAIGYEGLSRSPRDT